MEGMQIKEKAIKQKIEPRKELLKLGAYLIVIYLLLFALLYSPLYKAIILRPDGGTSQLYEIDKILDAKREEYFFESGGNKLHGWLFRKPGSDIVVLIHHGNAGNLLNRLFLAKAFIQAGTSVFLYDYRGYGKSTGATSLNGIIDDGLAAFDFVKTQFHFPIVFNYGESIGSGVACAVNSKRNANGLILQSGIVSLPKVAKDGVFFLNVFPDNLWPNPRLNNYAAVSQTRTPLLLLHGVQDKIVPISQSEALLSGAASPDKLLVSLPNCGHNDVGDQDAQLFQSTIAAFVQKHRQ